MKRGFIRGLWGIYDDSNRITKRRYNMDNDMNRIHINSYNEPFKVYVFGKENYDSIQHYGFDTKLINDSPAPFDLVKFQYRNKLEIIKYAMEEDGYDELIYLDWDCVPQKKLPENFWDEFQKKESFQANLQMYHRRKAYWRKEELRKVPNGGFIYLRDKTLPSKAISMWDTIQCDNDEPAWAKLTDEMMGGWQGIEKYWELFETPFCNLHKSSPYSKELLESKDVCFIHYQG